MRVLRMGALLLLCVGGSHQTRVRIECCDLWFTLNRYIQTHAGVDRSKCVPQDCAETGQIESFMSETNAALQDSLRLQGSTIVMDVSNSSTWQNMLVWSYLGRHFTNTRQQQVQDDLYFEFNIATRTMSLRKVQCAKPDLWDAGQAKTATQLRVKNNSLAWSWTGNIFDLPWHILASRHQETPSTPSCLPSFDIGKSPIMCESYCG